MNYFPFDPSPVIAARALDDKRLRRIFAESVMVMSVLRQDGVYNKRLPVPPRLRQWLEQETARVWFMAWTRALYDACQERFDIGHWVSADKYYQVGMTSCFAPPPQFINLACSKAKGLDYTHIQDVSLAYRLYVDYQWRNLDKRKPTWTAHGPPSWYTGE